MFHPILFFPKETKSYQGDSTAKTGFEFPANLSGLLALEPKQKHSRQRSERTTFYSNANGYIAWCNNRTEIGELRGQDE
jgi:hypothetical protein